MIISDKDFYWDKDCSCAWVCIDELVYAKISVPINNDVISGDMHKEYIDGYYYGTEYEINYDYIITEEDITFVDEEDNEIEHEMLTKEQIKEINKLVNEEVVDWLYEHTDKLGW